MSKITDILWGSNSLEIEGYATEATDFENLIILPVQVNQGDLYLRINAKVYLTGTVNTEDYGYITMTLNKPNYPEKEYSVLANTFKTNETNDNPVSTLFRLRVDFVPRCIYNLKIRGKVVYGDATPTNEFKLHLNDVFYCKEITS